mmetsp:Transcript_11263/g.33362  ORF Transcript_11263/g.33362 Transcript_11263/m.33362 type:complete len:249 (+) Transcript_11263:155-901(+)
MAFFTTSIRCLLLCSWRMATLRMRSSAACSALNWWFRRCRRFDASKRWMIPGTRSRSVGKCAGYMTTSHDGCDATNVALRAVMPTCPVSAHRMKGCSPKWGLSLSGLTTSTMVWPVRLRMSALASVCSMVADSTMTVSSPQTSVKKASFTSPWTSTRSPTGQNWKATRRATTRSCVLVMSLKMEWLTLPGRRRRMFEWMRASSATTLGITSTGTLMSTERVSTVAVSARLRPEYRLSVATASRPKAFW